MLAPTSLIAIAAWWHYSRVWWASLGALATAGGIILYLPVREACEPTTENTAFFRAGEFVVFGSERESFWQDTELFENRGSQMTDCCASRLPQARQPQSNDSRTFVCAESSKITT